VAELADALDSKSSDRKIVWVRSPPPAHLFYEVKSLDSKFANFTYRGNNMPGYYLIGIVTSVFWIALSSLLIGTRELSRPVKFFLPLGLSSLFSYTTGNVLPNLSRYVAPRVDPTLYTAVFFVSVLIITKYIDRMPSYEHANELMHLRFPRRAHAEASLAAGQRSRSE
jgi:hypothetical protein